MDAAEYKHIVLGLIFLKYVSDAFIKRREELARRFSDAARQLLHRRRKDGRQDLEERDYYTEANVFWVQEKARWEHLRNNAKQPDIYKSLMMRFSRLKAKTPD